MEREILFEVLRADNKEIVGYERIGERGQWEHKRIKRDEWLLGAITDGQEYSKFIRRQFTGLTDKNGVKIFELDIVKSRYFPIGADKKVIEYYHIGLVIWPYYLMLKKEGTKILNKNKALSHHKDKEEVYVHPTAGKDYVDKSGLLNRELTVIGNIHSNPELLKQENQ